MHVRSCLVGSNRRLSYNCLTHERQECKQGLTYINSCLAVVNRFPTERGCAYFDTPSCLFCRSVWPVFRLVLALLYHDLTAIADSDATIAIADALSAEVVHWVLGAGCCVLSDARGGTVVNGQRDGAHIL